MRFLITFFVLVSGVLMPSTSFAALEDHSFGGRSYQLYMPDRQNGLVDEHSKDLVVYLHGMKNEGADAGAWPASELIAESERRGFILALPEGTLSRTPFGPHVVWNARYCCYEAAENSIDDVSFVERLITELQSRYEIDRVFVIGYSNGGMLAPHLWTNGTRIDAVAILSGGIWGDEPPPQHAIPTLFASNAGDSVIKDDGGTQLLGWTEPMLPVVERGRYLARNNGCEPASQPRKYRGVRIWEHQEGCPDAPVYQYLFERGGHYWEIGVKRVPIIPLVLNWLNDWGRDEPEEQKEDDLLDKSPSGLQVASQ